METVASEGKRGLSPEDEEARTARAYARKRRKEGVSGGAAAVVDAFERVIGKPKLKNNTSESAGSEDYTTPNGSTEKARHEAVMEDIRKLQRQYLHGRQHS